MDLNKLEVYSSSNLAEVFPLSNSIEEDLFQITNIDGLDPVKASIDSTSLGITDGDTITGAKVPSRNIVLTVRINPDWSTWTFESLRRALYKYFMPKNTVDLLFHMDGPNFKISGTIESVGANPFSKEPEFIVSIICPDPYFVKITPTIYFGTVLSSGSATEVMNEGDVPIGLEVKLPSGFETGTLNITTENISYSEFQIIVEDELTFPNTFELNSQPLHKFVRTVEVGDGVITNLFKNVLSGSKWSVLQPGKNFFGVFGPMEGDPWELRFYERYGGL